MSTLVQYPTDLTEAQWLVLQPLLPPRKWCPGGPGRPPCGVRTILNGVLYVTKAGCQWRMLPKEFGRWETVYGYFNRWSRQGIWQQLMVALNRQERQRQDRKPTPSAGCIDSQSIKTATQGKTKGYDGNKKINGRKRHLLVDTLGLILRVVVTAADTGDRAGLIRLLKAYFAPGVQRLRKLWVDGGYNGEELKAWVRSLKQTHKVDLEVVESQGPGFQVVKRRWVVERTFAWLLNYRRHSKDYEILTRNSEALIQVAMIHLLVKRLAA
ncbi:MAG: IS5 family transposase [Gallionella sp.]|nr:IS5 family transposase [Gallionella sp.]